MTGHLASDTSSAHGELRRRQSITLPSALSLLPNHHPQIYMPDPYIDNRLENIRAGYAVLCNEVLKFPNVVVIGLGSPGQTP